MRVIFTVDGEPGTDNVNKDCYEALSALKEAMAQVVSAIDHNFTLGEISVEIHQAELYNEKFC